MIGRIAILVCLFNLKVLDPPFVSTVMESPGAHGLKIFTRSGLQEVNTVKQASRSTHSLSIASSFTTHQVTKDLCTSGRAPCAAQRQKQYSQKQDKLKLFHIFVKEILK